MPAARHKWSWTYWCRSCTVMSFKLLLSCWTYTYGYGVDRQVSLACLAARLMNKQIYGGRWIAVYIICRFLGARVGVVCAVVPLRTSSMVLWPLINCQKMRMTSRAYIMVCFSETAVLCCFRLIRDPVLFYFEVMCCKIQVRRRCR